MLLDQYVRTAAALREGRQVSSEAMSQFHGTTGLLLAEIYGDLWTQGELREMMMGMIREHHRDCRQQQSVGGKTLGERLGDALIENARLIVVCVTVVVVAAIMWQQLPQLGQMIDRSRAYRIEHGRR